MTDQADDESRRNKVFLDIERGRFYYALIRLYVWATGQTNFGQTLAIWRMDVQQAHLDKDRRAMLVSSLGGILNHKHDASLTALRSATELELIWALDDYLSNERPHTELSKGESHGLQIGDCTYTLVRRDFLARKSAAAERQPPSPAHDFKHFRVIPSKIRNDAEFDIALIKLDSLCDSIEALVSSKRPAPSDIKCLISHFKDDVSLCVDYNDVTKHFTITNLSDESIRENSINQDFDNSVEEAHHIWIMPELTVPANLRRNLLKKINRQQNEGAKAAPFIVVPGSFHMAGNHPQRLINQAVIADDAGRIVLKHNKMTLFSAPMKDQKLYTEGIVPSRQVSLLLTPIGLIAIAICKDFIDKTSAACDIWRQLAPDWILIPSMGLEDTTTLHRKQAKECKNVHGICSIVANQEPYIQGAAPPPQLPGFAVLAEDDG